MESTGQVQSGHMGVGSKVGVLVVVLTELTQVLYRLSNPHERRASRRFFVSSLGPPVQVARSSRV